MNFNVQAIDRPDHIEQAGENETQDVIVVQGTRP